MIDDKNPETVYNERMEKKDNENNAKRDSVEQVHPRPAPRLTF